MIQFNEAQFSKVIKEALIGAVREFQKQNKDIKVTNLVISHDLLFNGSPAPSGMSYHIVADISTVYPLIPEKSEEK